MFGRAVKSGGYKAMRKRQITSEDGHYLSFDTCAGMFINDALAEEKAEELRERNAPVRWGGEKGGAKL